MKWTNKYGLPDCLGRAIEGMGLDYRKEGDLSVTELCTPPRILWLRRRHADEIEEDYADNIWRLLGSSVHYMIHKAASPNSLQEESLVLQAGPMRISGRPDLLEGRSLDDFKVTSAWSVINDLKPEWEAQLNFYAVLYRSYGFQVDRLRIIAVLRDWSAGRAKNGGDYPSKPAQIVEVPLWRPDVALERLIDAAKEKYRLLQQDAIPHACDEYERWHRPDTWAVMKKGKKRALRVLESEAAAVEYWDGITGPLDPKHKDYSIEHRPGADVRCADYCNVNKWCDFWQAQQVAP